MNINTYEYWERRFRSGGWNNNGRRQTFDNAIANVTQRPIGSNFTGKLLDFGCAQGNAIPVYRKNYPEARLSGYDISDSAITYCRRKYESQVKFYAGDFNNIEPVKIFV